ncbi:transmembrane protein 62-like [Centruroides sculpturatus]|uniref:transmembrane protein 62-like n=1 Tax=Centruroides sculpturatus TaxID=218467 RepID=UPI000C6D4CA1|nr:transmembrane protein 62-like [Centruroides sculpturatus]
MRPAYHIQYLMALTKVTILIILCLAVLSTLLAKFQNLVYIDNDVPSNITFIGSEGPYPNNQYRHLMIFLQVSDIHLSLFRDFTRGPDLKRFCKEVIPVIQPSVVLATGDLVDATTPDHLGSRQFEEEWKTYQKILFESGVAKETVWLDIRGNHDNFNTVSLDKEDNLFRRYSIQGHKHNRSYNYTFHHGSDTYTFIGINACLEPGPKRPFNFLGIINQDEYRKLQKMEEQSRNSNMTIWFGHYPTSTIAAPYPGARELMRDSGPYLCGHLHTLGGMVPIMYTLQSTGSLELELGDWKDNRRYRLAAVDHGIFTFIDQNLNDWPVILITNPKHALYGMPTVEPLSRIKKSTHIRVLTFSPSGIKLVKLQIDDEPWQNMTHVSKGLYTLPWISEIYAENLHTIKVYVQNLYYRVLTFSPSGIKLVKLQIDDEPWQNMTHVSKGLYTLPWISEIYAENLHTIKVYVQDKKGREKIIEQSFSLDGSRPVFPLGARFALMGHISIGQTIFSILMVIAVIPLCILRCLHHYGKTRFIRIRAECNCVRRWLFKFYLLSSVDHLLWPIIFIAVYIAIGPWFIGEIIDGYIGACFVWGIVIAGKVVPGGLTFIAGSIFNSTKALLVIIITYYSFFIEIFNFFIGPWFIGEIIDGYIGACFVWGIVIAGKVVPGGLTFIAGSIFMLTFYIPVVLLLTHCLYNRYQVLLNIHKTKCAISMYICQNVSMIVFIIWQILCAVGYYYSYGLMAFLLGFTTTWSVIFVLVLWRITVTLPYSKLPVPIRPLNQEQQIGGEPLLLAEDLHSRDTGDKIPMRNQVSAS